MQPPQTGLDRREFLCRSGAAAVTLAAGSFASPLKAGTRSATSRRPNLLFVFSDQQSFDMLGCNGNPDILTPNTDRFAAEGVRFTHCFSNAPVCTPYRGMLMSGKHPLHNGAFENDFPLCPQAGPHFGSILQGAGYRTGYVGKWHLLGGNRKRPVPEGPLRAGFDGTFLTDNCTTEYRAGHCFYYDDAGNKAVFDQWQPYGQTDQAVAFLRESANQEDPFALFVSWHPPHDNGRKPPPPDPHYDYSHYPRELAEHYAGRRLKLRPGINDTPKRQEQLRDYYAMCTGIDLAFGRLLETLREQGLDDNTIVVFTSDHGDVLGGFDAPRPKRIPHDYSARVPLVIRFPGRLAAGRQSDLLIGALDLMPTLLGMMGLAAAGDVHGRDLTKPILSGDDDAVDSIPMLMISWPQFRGVITREWTFGMGPDGQENKFNSVLFDRQEDPHQQDNRFEDEDYRSVNDEMERLTRHWMDRFEDPFVTIRDLTKHQSLEAWREPPGVPEDWPIPIDVIHGRVKPLGKPKPVFKATAVAGWQIQKDLRVEPNDSFLILQSTGRDPIMSTDDIDVPAGPVVVAIQMRSDTGGRAQWFWSSGQPYSPDRAAWMPLRPNQNWNEYRVEIPVQGQLKSLRFDPAQSSGEIGIAWIELQDQNKNTLRRWEFSEQQD